MGKFTSFSFTLYSELHTFQPLSWRVILVLCPFTLFCLLFHIILLFPPWMWPKTSPILMPIAVPGWANRVDRQQVSLPAPDTPVPWSEVGLGWWNWCCPGKSAGLGARGKTLFWSSVGYEQWFVFEKLWECQSGGAEKTPEECTFKGFQATWFVTFFISLYKEGN